VLSIIPICITAFKFGLIDILRTPSYRRFKITWHPSSKSASEPCFKNWSYEDNSESDRIYLLRLSGAIYLV